MQLAKLENPVATMSSLELVEYINDERGDSVAQLRHDHFMTKVQQVLGEAAPKFMGTAKYINGTGAEVSRNIYNFPKREACLMAMSYSYELQAKVYDKMTALEAMQAPKPKTRLELARENVALIEEIEEKDKLLALQAPAVAFVDKYVEAKSSKCLSDVAKILGKKPQAFIQILAADGVLFKRGGSWIPAQSYLDDGKFTVKTGDASGHAYHQTRVEPKGIEWLAREYAQ